MAFPSQRRDVTPPPKAQTSERQDLEQRLADHDPASRISLSRPSAGLSGASGAGPRTEGTSSPEGQSPASVGAGIEISRQNLDWHHGRRFAIGAMMFVGVLLSTHQRHFDNSGGIPSGVILRDSAAGTSLRALFVLARM